METEVIAIENQDQEIQTRNFSLLDQARHLAVAITSNETWESAARFLVQIRQRIELIKKRSRPAIEAAHRAHQEAIAFANSLKQPLEEAREVLAPAIDRWEAEQREKARIEREKAEREEKKRQEDKRLEMAEELERSGKTEQAEDILNAPIMATPVVVEEAPKAAGLAFQDYYSFQVEDLKALVVAVAEGRVPLIALLPNEKFLGQQARSLKDQFKYPGVKLIHSRRSKLTSGGAL